ncbi:Receptor-type tyrosine-protein phosphatase mu [Fasciolopsis buskii]|uniref:Receptor-type tyrosine-protein phosphatase mu n=1 Tax=Fasciolopsis buskii TaxID=27845 RepID=A0A8E0RTI5_9TREM|nr:Receptor-type tyrosine-protein phosphatase mu [Fasciolopsis buski]
MSLGYYLTFLWIYFVSLGLSELCTRQPLSFGPNCSHVCHCLDGDCDARTEGVGCLSGKCSPGFTGFPMCQDVCSQGKFGVNCESECFCMPVNLCESTNGNCLGNNKCNPNRFGPGCEGIRSQLNSIPEAFTDCEAINVSWRGRISGYYTGAAEIVQIFYKTFLNPELTEFKTVPETGSDFYTFKFIPDNVKETYLFSVRPDFQVSMPPDYYVETGVPSNLSLPVALQCPEAPDVQIELEGKTAIISWGPYNVSAVQRIQADFQLRSVGDCKQWMDVKPTLITSVADSVSLRTIQELEAWRQYSVEVYGLTRYGVRTLSKSWNVTTPPAAPTGAPRNLRLLGDTNETSAWITWEDPPCEDKLGSFKNYVIKVIPVMSVMMIPQSFSTTKPLLLLSGLLSNTTYAVSVAFENTVGVGPQTSLHFKTAVPAYPPSVRLVSQRPASTVVAWDAPMTGHGKGNLTGYQVSYWPSDSLNQMQTSGVLPDTICLELGRLKPLTDYKVQVFAIYGSQRFGSEVIPFRTLAEDTTNASLKLLLVSKNSSAITLTWITEGVPSKSTGNYSISISLKSTKLPQTPTFSKQQKVLPGDAHRQHTFDHLPAASEFEITILRNSDTGSASERDTLITWTHSAPFASSGHLNFSQLSLVSREQTTATVRFPTITGYDGGPLNGFYLVVAPTSANRSQELQAQMPAVILASPLPPNSVIAFWSDVWPSKPIVLGTGALSPARLPLVTKLSLPYVDSPLEISSTYLILAIVQSIVGNWVEETAVGVLVLLKPDSIGAAYGLLKHSDGQIPAIAGILSTLLVLLIICIVALILYYRGWWGFGWKRAEYILRKNPKVPSVVTFENSAGDQTRLLPESHAWWSMPVDAREPRYLIVDPDKGPNSTLVGTWSKNEITETFAREYLSIPTGYKYPHAAGTANENLVKNRSQTVLPYDHNRVLLKRPSDSTDTDYINASFIDGYMRRRAYIAAQSPFDTPTACDFWLMIFQRNCTQIVMLTNLVEDGTLKCCQYWPEVSFY